MAIVAINNTGWTQLAAAGTATTYQLISGQTAYVLKQDADPGADVKTGLIYRNEKGDSYDGTTGIWARLPVTGQGATGAFEVT